jgi:hypothetical protein
MGAIAALDVGEPGLRVDIIEPGGLDEGVENSGALTHSRETSVLSLAMTGTVVSSP